MSIKFIPSTKPSEDNESHWISLSDMMTGLMMIFLLISISFMVNANAQKQRLTNVVTTYEDTKLRLYDDLYKEFNGDLKAWGGELEPKTLTIRFHDPEILFEPGKANLKTNFEKILDDFIPRYIAILVKNKYIKSIQEVRIEGHTSSEWATKVSEDAAYLYNMDLSQQRTRSVLAYIIELPQIKSCKPWLKRHLTANGLSSSKLIVYKGKEDKNASRRVEFRIVTNTASLIDELIQKAGNKPPQKMEL